MTVLMHDAEVKILGKSHSLDTVHEKKLQGWYLQCTVINVRIVV
jgi:hypothetical protein